MKTLFDTNEDNMREIYSTLVADEQIFIRHNGESFFLYRIHDSENESYIYIFIHFDSFQLYIIRDLNIIVYNNMCPIHKRTVEEICGRIEDYEESNSST